MEIFMLGCTFLLPILTGVTAISIDQKCEDTQLQCNCSIMKRYNETRDILCYNSSANCSWFRIINNELQSIGDRVQVNRNGITLPGNFDPWGYGIFVSNKTYSCSYSVIPPIESEAAGYCDNCSEIIIDGIRRNNYEILYKSFGDDMIIKPRFPRVLEVLTFVARLNGNNIDLPANCICQLKKLLCKCSNLTFSNNGVYTIHISFNVTTIGNNPEWCSNNVTVIVQVTTVMFEKGAYNISENSTVQVVPVILSKPSSTEFTVEVHSEDITASGEADYKPGTYKVVFPVGQTHALLNITIWNDKILERKENFSLTINSSSLPNNINLGDPFQTTVTIVDDDVATVKFENEIYCINKSPEMTLNTSSSTDITVQVYCTPFGVDFIEQCVDTGPYNITFPAGKICAEVPLSISISEDNEMVNFTLNINSSLLPSNIIAGDPTQTIVTTLDEYCNASGDDENSNTGAIVGGTFGLVALIIIIACGCFYFKKKYSNKRCHDHQCSTNTTNSND